MSKGMDEIKKLTNEKMRLLEKGDCIYEDGSYPCDNMEGLDCIQCFQDWLFSYAGWQKKLEEMARQDCPLCLGSGEILRSKARMMGYTLSEGETIDEELVPCPLCCKLEEAVKQERGRILGKMERYKSRLPSLGWDFYALSISEYEALKGA